MLLIRQIVAEEGIAAYIIPHRDPHQSEYLADCYNLMPVLTGFTGSAGTMVVLPDDAQLWTDSRYFLQAEAELAGGAFRLMRLDVPHTPQYVNWLCERLSVGQTIGIDGALCSLSAYEHLSTAAAKHGLLVKNLRRLPAALSDRLPPFPDAIPIADHPAALAGESRRDKLQKIYAAVREHGCTHTLLTALDDIAWLFNLRGADVAFNPVFLSYALLDAEREAAHLCVNAAKIAPDLQADLQAAGVQLHPYDAITDLLSYLPRQATIWIDPNQLNYQLYELMKQSGYHLKRGRSVATALKSRKNDIAIAHLRRTMEKDGVAMVRLWRWLENALAAGEMVTELSLEAQLIALRREQPDYVGESFNAIVGYEAHGAIVHYHATPATNATIAAQGILLLDSGGQYRDGTTDITRTLALSPPTDTQRLHYTLVLKGHIALASQQFLEGTYGHHLDILARSALWQHGLNYGHGTGHGVGFFLNVHEGPHSISRAALTAPECALQAGMVISNEPGFYLEGAYGIRIENLVLVVAAAATDFGNFYQLETLTLCPIDTTLINPALLTAHEIGWLNAYHRTVFDRLAPALTNAEREWLAAKTQAIG